MDEIMEESLAEEDVQYLIFTVNTTDFGIDISLVQEIIQIQRIFKIPHTIDCCKGIINMRGTIVPVIDMRLKLGYEAAEYSDKTCIIVIMVETELIGMIVDIVKDVIPIASGDLIATPSLGKEIKNAEAVSKIATINGEIKQILDVYSVFEISR